MGLQLTNNKYALTVEDYKPKPDLLAERVILVTGAAEGIGRAVALACARHGANVVLSDKEQRELEPVYDEIEAEGRPEPALLPLDLEHADEKGLQGAIDLVGRELGRLDGLVHCAAFAPFLSRVEDYDAAEWERVAAHQSYGPLPSHPGLPSPVAGIGRRLGGLHRRPGGAQGNGLLGGILRRQVRDRGLDADPGRGDAGQQQHQGQQHRPGYPAHRPAGAALPGGGPGQPARDRKR